MFRYSWKSESYSEITGWLSGSQRNFSLSTVKLIKFKKFLSQPSSLEVFRSGKCGDAHYMNTVSISNISYYNAYIGIPNESGHMYISYVLRYTA